MESVRVCVCAQVAHYVCGETNNGKEKMVILLDGISFNRKLRRILYFFPIFSVYPASESMVVLGAGHPACGGTMLSCSVRALIRTNKSNIAHAHSRLGIKRITITIIPIIRLLFCLEPPSNLFPF